MQPKEVRAHDSVFAFLPSFLDIPEEFKKESNYWAKLAESWFFDGLQGSFKPKEGIDYRLALRHIRFCLQSFDPRHEHKIAGVAYLMSLWFDSFEARNG